MSVAVNDRIIVQVDMDQKSTMMIGNVKVLMATKYESNNREKNPVIALVVEGNENLNRGAYIVCHHNHFGTHSPYRLEDGFFSIPANHTIFAILRPSGKLSPVYGNVLASKVEIETTLPVPAEYRTFHRDRGVILDGGWTNFRPGDLVFTRPSAIYEIVYNWGDIQERICKINSQMICAVVRK